MNVLVFDVGDRHTGCALLNIDAGTIVALPTLHTDSEDALMTSIIDLATSRSIDHLVLGNPLLPSGEEGAQSARVLAVANSLRERDFVVELLDERYTTPRRASGDSHSAAACGLAEIYEQKIS